MEERHSRDGYFIVGEGLVGSTAPTPTGAVIFALNDGDQRPFRFSRVGPEGAQLGEPNRLQDRRPHDAARRRPGERLDPRPASRTSASSSTTT